LVENSSIYDDSILWLDLLSPAMYQLQDKGENKMQFDLYYSTHAYTE